MKDLEFLPEHHIRARQSQRLRFIRLWLLTVLVLAMVCWGYYSRRSVSGVQAELAAVQQKIAQTDVAKQRALLDDLTQKEKLYLTHAKLVAQVADQWPRAGLVREVAKCLPEQLVLSRLEIERQLRDPANAGALRNGQPVTGKETVDRVRLEGYASEDLALSRFLQTMNEGDVFQRGELAFSKDATFRDREVRVFAATFYVPATAGKPMQTARTGPQEGRP